VVLGLDITPLLVMAVLATALVLLALAQRRP